MSYKVQYNPEFAKRYPTKRKQKRNLLPFIIIIAVLFFAYFALGTNTIDAVFTGDRMVAVSAFSGLVESVESGDSVKSALLELCRDIVVSGAN